MSDVTKSMSIKVKIKGMRRFRARMIMASIVMQVAAWIMPIKCEIEYNGPK